MDASLTFLLIALVVAVFFLFSPMALKRPVSGGKRFLLGLLQWVPLALVAWLIFDPLASRRESETVHPVVALVWDDSPSMGFEDGIEGQPRIETVRKWVTDVQETWPDAQRQLALDSLALSELVPAHGSGSDFAQAFITLSGRYPAGRLQELIFVSDGQDRSLDSTMSAAESLKVPIHTLGIGPELPEKDVDVLWIEVPRSVAPRSAFLARYGLNAELASPLEVNLRIEFDSLEVSSESMTLEPPTTYREKYVTVSSEDPGVHLLRVWIEESRTGNRVAEATTEITIEERIPTILLLESRPNLLSRGLVQSVLKDGRFRVVRPVPLPDGEGGAIWTLSRPVQGESDSEVPVMDSGVEVTRLSAADWPGALGSLLKENPILVLGDSPWAQFPADWPNITAQEIESQPGGILALPGSDVGLEGLPEGSLRNLLAWMRSTRFSPTPIQIKVPESQHNSAALAPIWSYLGETWSIGPDRFFDPVPGLATPLLVDDAERLLAFETPVGFSRAILVSLRQIWDVRSADSTDALRGKNFRDGLFIGLIDALASGTSAGRSRVTAKPSRPVVGQRVEFLVEDPVLSPGPPVSGLQVRSGSEEWTALLLVPDPTWRGVGRATWMPRATGSYEVRYASGESTASIEVTAQPPESGDRALNSKLLAEIAERTGGKASAFADRAGLVDSLSGKSTSVVRTGMFPLRHDIRLGAAIAVLFCLGWAIRRFLALP